MASLYNHAELEYRWRETTHSEIGTFEWEAAVPKDIYVNYGYDAAVMTASFFRADRSFRWREEYEDQIYGFYLMIGRIWEIASVSAGNPDCEAGSVLTDLNRDMEQLLSEPVRRPHAVIALLMKYSHTIRRLYHENGTVSHQLLLQYSAYLAPYAPCMSHDLQQMLQK